MSDMADDPNWINLDPRAGAGVPAKAAADPRYFMGWPEVFERLSKVGKRAWVYGIPRGGAVVAGLMLANGQAADVTNDPLKADVIVDDIIDSGRTMERHKEYLAGQNSPYTFALVDKTGADKDIGWVVFPWEERDETADIEDVIVRQIEFIGEDPTRQGLVDTPRRVSNALLELTVGYQADIGKLLSVVFDEEYDEMVVVDGIPFYSLCEHHMLPFNGMAKVGYIPNGKVLGLSKIPRLVHAFSRRLQIQERLTNEIAHSIEEAIAPKGVGVVIEARHSCMAMRGVHSMGTMTTSCLLGVMRTGARAEFLQFGNH